MHITKLYKVVEDGEAVFIGSAAEIQKHLNLPGKDIVYAYARSKYKLYGKYEFIYEGVRKSEGNKKNLKKEKAKPTKHETDLEWIRIALNKPPRYMTGYHSNAKEFVDELAAEGIRFKAVRCPGEKYYWLYREMS